MPSPTHPVWLPGTSARYTGTKADTVQCPQKQANARLSCSELVGALEEMTSVVVSGNFYCYLSNLKQAKCPSLLCQVLSQY